LNNLKNIKTAIILAGGKGTRLKEVVSDVPKPMAPINNRPFLEYLMEVGIVANLDFFDETLYGDEIEHKTVEEKELEDFTNPEDYEEPPEQSPPQAQPTGDPSWP
jgi:NDP-sugar pyrophosphorylase family protein